MQTDSIREEIEKLFEEYSKNNFMNEESVNNTSKFEELQNILHNFIEKENLKNKLTNYQITTIYIIFNDIFGDYINHYDE